MKIRFWGVQGSIPNPLSSEQLQLKIKEILRRTRGQQLDTEEQRQTFLESLPLHLTHTTGGNTTCFEVLSERGDRLIIDMGSGARRLGLNLLQEDRVKAGTAEIFVLLTHLHWDHILGFPFFLPAYIETNSVHFYGGHDYMAEALVRQTHPQSFPVPLTDMGCTHSFQKLEEGKEYDINGFVVSCKRLQHPNFSYAYRIADDDRTLVIATDGEYKELDADYLWPFVEFYRDADLLVFDAQYTLKDVFQKVDWGHSSSFIGVDLCLMANVPRLALTHHDPSYTDSQMLNILQNTAEFKSQALEQHRDSFRHNDLEVIMAYEGLELPV